jgi:PAS domain-containing protein
LYNGLTSVASLQAIGLHSESESDRLEILVKNIPKTKQQLLMESETRYRRLFETAEDGILILEAKTGQIADVNPFLVKMLGYTYEDFLGKKLWEIGPFKNLEASKAIFYELQSK